MSDVSQDDKTMAMIGHISGLVTIGPLIIWLMNKDNPEKAFVASNAKEATNFVITVWLAMISLVIVSTVLAFIPVLGWIVGLLLWIVMMFGGLGAAVLMILGGMKANEGVDYRYPFALRLIK